MSPSRAPLALIRGGGELATGAAHALWCAGARVLVLERARPTALRLGVAFASAVVSETGRFTVAGVEAILVHSHPEIVRAWQRGKVAVWIGGEERLRAALGAGAEPPTRPERGRGPGLDLLIDGRLRQLSAPLTTVADAPCVIGIGPGFEVGRDAHFVIESNRGARLGEVLTAGHAEPHTGIPGEVLGYREPRILRAPQAGEWVRHRALGDFVAIGDVVGEVDGAPVRAALGGMIRGLKLTGVPVGAHHKVGDVDPRRDRALLTTMTDKAVAIGRGVVRAAALGGARLEPGDQGAGDPVRVVVRRKEGTSCI